MANVEVKFLGKEYQLPDCLPKYVSILEVFEGYTNQLLQKVIDQAKKGDYSGGADVDFAFWKEPIEEIAKDIIKRASKDGVYDLTITELVDQNPGFQQLHQVCKDTMQGMVKALLNAMDDWMAGYNSAHAQAASNITGSGISVWTNSLSTALLYTAFESSTIKRQCNQADRDFEAAMRSLNASNFSKQEQDELRVKTQIYYPGCNAAIVTMTSQMLSIYLDKIGKTSSFDYSSVKKYDMAASMEILKNLSLVDGKQEVLYAAFEKCPYNPDLYTELINLGFIDFESFSVAKYLGQSSILLRYIMQYCEKSVEGTSDISEAVRIWADYESINERDVYCILYKKTVKAVSDGLSFAVRAIDDVSQCKKWIAQNITYSIKSLLKKQEELSYAVSESISRIVDSKTYYMLLQLDLLDVSAFNVTGEATTDYARITGGLIAGLTGKIKLVIEEIIANQDRACIEIERLKQEVTEKLKIKDDMKREFDERLLKLRTEREKCGFFAFSRRKELDAQINATEEARKTQLRGVERDIQQLHSEIYKKENRLDDIT